MGIIHRDIKPENILLDAPRGNVRIADFNAALIVQGGQPLEDGDEVFGLQIVATPGHTAGHVATFDPDSGVLVAGDAFPGHTLRNISGNQVVVATDKAVSATVHVLVDQNSN